MQTMVTVSASAERKQQNATVPRKPVLQKPQDTRHKKRSGKDT